MSMQQTGLTFPHWALHIPHDETVLVVQKLHADLCDLHMTNEITSSAGPASLVVV